MIRGVYRPWSALLALAVALGVSACDDDSSSSDPPTDAAIDAEPAVDVAVDAGEDCSPGTEGCRCLMDGTCRLAHLMCVEDRCIDPAAECDPARQQCPPADPQCYTPCQGDLIAEDGTLRVCSSEGLMRGCMGGNVCDRGSCVPAGVQKQAGPAPGTCGIETDCPDFQTCILGRCYSDCAADVDCADGDICHRQVCRQRCTDETPCAESDETCLDGVCLPLGEPDPAAPLSAGESFELTVDSLVFSRAFPTAAFVIRNTGQSPLTVTVRKDEQLTVDDAGREQRIVDQPLLWLTMGVDGVERVQQFEVMIDAESEVEVILADADAGMGRWRGRLAVEAPGLGARYLRLSYSEEVHGRWAGTAYAFGTFPDGARPYLGDFPLDDWRADRGDTAPLETVPNAFLQAWGRYRNGDLGLPEMAALIDATLTGSWDFPRVRELCREAGFDDNSICAPFGGAGSRSVIPYTTTADINRVPAGVIAMDFAIEVQPADGATGRRLCGETAQCFTGRIDSDTALQYAGDPEVTLAFAADPRDCQRQGAAGCTVDIDRFESKIGVGRRFRAQDRFDGLAPGCGGLGDRIETPWLVPGLPPPDSNKSANHTPFDPADPIWRECHEPVGPGDPGPAANPILDGVPRLRRLELIDGQLVEQNVMTLILRETIDPFHGGEPLQTYLYVVLQRTETGPDALRPEGQFLSEDRPAPFIDMGATCALDLMRTVRDVRALDSLAEDDIEALARVVVGGDAGGGMAPLGPREVVHSLCIWSEDAVQNAVGDDALGQSGDVNGPTVVRREVIDAGPGGDRPCFPGAEIIYFTTSDNEDPAGWDCNTTAPESCLERLQTGIDRGDALRFEARARTYLSLPEVADEGRRIRAAFDLVYRCDDPERPACTDDRFDLTAGKAFGRADGAGSHFSPLSADVVQAFRYKTQFVDRIGGAQVGFAPSICRPGASLNPYCYDPAAIEAVRARVDCAMAIYSGWLDGQWGLADDVSTLLRGALVRSFDALEQDNPFGDPIVQYGFERLYAELVIMLGDDAYTSAFASRFDLDGSARLAFEGSRFEEGGIDLTGAAGYEMYKLHQATQYYALVLDRFFTMSVRLWNSLDAGDGARYVTLGTVTTWLDRVIRASTQSANAWSEIARRYRGLNRPDLARRVLVRAYTRAYQESLVLRAMMTAITDVLDPAELPQVEAAIQDAQTRYRVAMLDMQSRFQEISGRLDVFGLPPELIPFPALDEDDVNGFEVMLERAMQRMDIALEDEEAAIDSRRDFDVDAVSFQSELVTLRNGFEAELGEICGTFIGDDGRVYPAVARYAHLHPDLAELDDPCGAFAVGNGALWLAGADLQTRELELQRVRQEVANAQGAMADAQAQVADQCNLIAADVATFLQNQGAIDGLERDNDRMTSAITQLDKVHDFVTELTARVGEVGEDAPTKPWSAAIKASQTIVFGVSAAVNLVATSALEIAINVNQDRIRGVERAYEAYTIKRECDYLQADLVYTLRDLHRDLLLVELDVLNAIWNVQVEFSNIQSLVNQRSRLEAEWRDAEQLAINAAAAQSDPNIRIFKNDAIINADRSFDAALAAAWKATRMLEYYTAQSYPDRDKLFLARMVNRGDINLRRYLQDLEDDFFDFEQTFGNPDTRLAIVSMRDDVLRIPRYAADGAVLGHQARLRRFRAAIQDPARLDDRGALELNFSTTFDQLSPLTANHKILFIEVALMGEDLGDRIGRIYLSQRGTGVVEGTDDRRRFFTFPARTAVMNPFFNDDDSRYGQDSDGAIAGPTRSLYRSYRFRERPLVQTDWSLVLDQRNEEVNRDINLGGVDDIVVFIYYTDFTRD